MDESREFESAYLTYLRCMRALGQIPASREVVTEQAKRGSDRLPEVIDELLDQAASRV